MDFVGRNGQANMVLGERPDGTIAHISQTPSGLECDCVCPACRKRLVARKGQANAHHFGHYGVTDERSCAAGPETALHKFAKEVLERRLELVLPKLELEDDHDRWEGHPGGKFRFDAAVLEKRLGEIVPDVIVRRGDHDLLIEFVVTHECDPGKVAKIKELDLSAIEINLSKLPRDTSAKGIEKAILADASRRWLHNPKLDEGRTYLAKRRRERETSFSERVASLRKSYTVAQEMACAKPALRTPNKLAEFDLALAAGLDVPGAGCFLVPPYDWQAAILLDVAGSSFRGGAPFISLDRAMQSIRKRRWINRQFSKISRAEAAAIRADGTPFCGPENAIVVWATELSRRGVLVPTKSGSGWVVLSNTIQAASQRAKDAAKEKQRRRELPERRLAEIRNFVTKTLNFMTYKLKIIPEQKLAEFSFDEWIEQPLPRRPYSVTQAVHSDVKFAFLEQDLRRLFFYIRLKPSTELDLMGLPLSEALVHRSKARSKVDAEQEHFRSATNPVKL